MQSHGLPCPTTVLTCVASPPPRLSCRFVFVETSYGFGDGAGMGQGVACVFLSLFFERDRWIHVPLTR